MPCCSLLVDFFIPSFFIVHIVSLFGFDFAHFVKNLTISLGFSFVISLKIQEVAFLTSDSLSF